MDTKLFDVSEEDLAEAAALIKQGGLVAFPTETVYGLGGDAFNRKASRDIYAAKGRPQDNPLITHIAAIEQLSTLAEGPIASVALMLAGAFWPGPLTMVFPKKEAVPYETTGGLNTVAVRMPRDEAALSLIRLSGTAIAAPSANISGRPSPTMWQHVYEDLNGRIDGIIKGSPCMGGIESTVLDITGKTPVILRPGLITPEDIEAVIHEPVCYDPAILGSPDKTKTLVPRAPGMKYKHYAPRAELILFNGEPVNVRIAIEKRAALERQAGKHVGVLIYNENECRLLAKEFFAKLRALDDENADIILATALPMDDSLGFSVMNRMLKAAGYKTVEV